MDEKVLANENPTPKSCPVKNFFLDVIRGIAIGVAFIIPGFSGGSIAAILGIYERLITAIADIFKDFKKSFITILPIGLGMVCGIISLLYPLGWALERYPLPTVCLFVGLSLGALPSITDKLKGKFKITNAFSLFIPLAFALVLSFLPIGKDVDLLSLSLGGYILLIIIGFVGSSALVVPGISGSMLLLILGYYNPLIKLITENLLNGINVSKSILVLGLVALGIAVGFVFISVIMKKLLANYPRGTHFAILGFILASIPTVYVSTAKDAGMTIKTLPTSLLHWIFCVVLLFVGIALALGVVIASKKKKQ